MSQRGKFIWYDLLTADRDAAVKFYRSVVGWGTEVSPGPEPYTMWTAGKTPVGGVRVTAGAPQSWLGYAETRDLTASLARVAQLGGSVTGQLVQVPNVGSYAVVRDPQGATFALFQVANPDVTPEVQGDGALSWAELNTTDWEGAWTFYSALLGWKPTQSMEMGELGTYFMFNGREDPEGKSMGGMSNAATMMHAPPHWLYYATVPDLNAALERVKAGGGKVLNGPREVPGGNQIAQCADPQGGYFALYQE